jgi:preprotein translocase SecF subunit
MAALTRIKETLGAGVEYRSIDTVGPKASEELLSNGVIAVVLCLIAMLLYVAVRFQWRFGVCAIFSLIHDAFYVVGFYVFTNLEFNMPAILAILITIGYSINDTVVIYDRIRENLAKYKKMEIPELINRSMNETLSRTTITSGTTVLSVLFLYLFGGEVIATYSLPILIGIIVGTFSSICLSGPLLVYFDIRALPKEVDGFKPSINEN